MANYNLSVELTALPGATIQPSQVDGKMYVLIPVEAADLFLTEAGKCFLSLSMWEKRVAPDEYGKTHGVKQSLSRSRREQLGADAARNMPFIGSAKPISAAPGQQPPAQNHQPYIAQPPQGYTPPAPQNPSQNFQPPF